MGEVCLGRSEWCPVSGPRAAGPGDAEGPAGGPRPAAAAARARAPAPGLMPRPVSPSAPREAPSLVLLAREALEWGDWCLPESRERRPGARLLRADPARPGPRRRRPPSAAARGACGLLPAGQAALEALLVAVVPPEHVARVGVQGPEGALAGLVGRAGHLEEAVVEGQRVADGVLPALVLPVEGEEVHDPVDLAQRQHLLGLAGGHGDERDV